MKRLVAVISVLLLIFILSSCGAELVAIEDLEWKMSAVMSNNVDATQSENDFVIAVGEADDIHPNAQIVELTLSAKDGELTLVDVTNSKTYIGTYKIMNRTPKSIDYEIVIDGISGYATVARTEYYDGSETPTLPINLGEYALYFAPNEYKMDLFVRTKV